MTVLIFLFLFSSAAFAAEIEPVGTPLRKLQRGFLNIALSPAEMSYELHNVRKVDNVVPSWATAMSKGFFYMGGRILAGAYDILTFPVPAPKNYEPLVYPEFAWEHFDKPKA
ncbi:MAG: exosortase system-associated protein, TIGR04073 family [Candidatus Omnitrophica bacterium]|nr:exosortase system-associated protein, TIGR04073 family [Candidatus Omnitrophota bacterium]